MPPPKTLLKMEKLREKGMEVSYPRAPWYTDHKEELLAEETEREKRIKAG